MNISDRLNNLWTPTEKNWFIYATNICEGYSNQSMYGFLLPEIPRTVDQFYYNEKAMDVGYVYGNALAGQVVQRKIAFGKSATVL